MSNALKTVSILQPAIIIIGVLLTACSHRLSKAVQPATFKNPLLNYGADPWSVYKDGFYYYMHTMSDSLVIWKTKDIAQLKTAEHKTVWIPPKNEAYSKQLWAPELHYIDKKWYIYFAADNGRNANHRMYVIENASDDPMKSDWTLKGKISDSTDKWAIDGSVFEYEGKSYMIWSGWQGNKNGAQDIYIARLKNPWTIDGNRARISASFYDWEKYGDIAVGAGSDEPSHVDVNEGPQILQHDKKLFLVYSASGCWTDHYGLGMLSFTGDGNLLDSAAWQKSPTPVFKGSKANGVYAPGHNSFFKSPDGKEDWLLYHANSEPNKGCGGHRTPRAQKFDWSSDGSPNFGEPVKPGVSIPAPSGKTP